jgi:IS5 family transposase
MLRTVGDQPTLWESLLPPQALVMGAHLAAVDGLLDDPRFFDPYRRFFHATVGRRSIPIETYLRLMFLKYRYHLGFERTCAEVTDSISWQRFCRIPLGGSVPHPTTLMKITSRCGQEAIDALNEALLVKAVEAKVLRTNRLRADTTVVEANVAYPTDSGLLAKGVAKMAATAKRLRAAGFARRTKLADRTRTVRARARSIAANLRRRSDDKLAEVKRINGDLAGIAERVAGQADAVVRNARRKLRRQGERATGRAKALVDELERTAGRVRRIAAQTRQRLAGDTPDGATRVVSLHDGDARPMRRAGSANPSSSATKPSSSTTTTASSSTTTSRPATRPTRRCSFRRSCGSRPGSGGRPALSPRTAATAKLASKRVSKPPGSATSCCPAKVDPTRRAARSSTAGRSARWSAGEPAAKDASAAPNATSG